MTITTAEIRGTRTSLLLAVGTVVHVGERDVCVISACCRSQRNELAGKLLDHTASEEAIASRAVGQLSMIRRRSSERGSVGEEVDSGGGELRVVLEDAAVPGVGVDEQLGSLDPPVQVR